MVTVAVSPFMPLVTLTVKSPLMAVLSSWSRYVVFWPSRVVVGHVVAGQALGDDSSADSASNWENITPLASPRSNP